MSHLPEAYYRQLAAQNGVIHMVILMVILNNGLLCRKNIIRMDGILASTPLITMLNTYRWTTLFIHEDIDYQSQITFLEFLSNKLE